MENKGFVDYPVVEVEWMDAQTSTESEFIEDLQKHLKPLKSKSCGYLIHEEKDYIVLCFLNFGNQHSKHHQVIPKGMISKVSVFSKRSNVSNIRKLLKGVEGG